MFEEDLDIGYYAEDAYAAYVAHLATQLHIIPVFSNARGASVEAIFTGPFRTMETFVSAAEAVRQARSIAPAASCTSASTPIWEEVAMQPPPATTSTSIVLHAWIEKLNGARKVQLMEPVLPLDLSSTGGSAATPASNPAQYCVLGNLDFLLHLATHDLLMGESNVSHDAPDMETYGAASTASRAGLSDDECASCATRDALEQRDDNAVARNAVDTLLKFAQLAQEHAGQVATVHVDREGGEEYLAFESANDEGE